MRRQIDEEKAKRALADAELSRQKEELARMTEELEATKAQMKKMREDPQRAAAAARPARAAFPYSLSRHGCDPVM